MSFFDIINGASSAINQFTGAMGTNQFVPPLEVDSGGIIGDGFDWLRGVGGGLGAIPANLLQNTYTSVYIRRALTGLPYGGERPVNNINTRFKVAKKIPEDWRVKLLVPFESPIFQSLNVSSPMRVLKKHGGIVFPYTPQIETSSVAEYEDLSLTHSNYNVPAYNKSKSDNITITADFSANDELEASYCMGVIHFFRTVTKMFFGNDGSDNGRPPPILILRGYGTYMFNNVPVVCKGATVTFPKDVDYVPSIPMDSGSLSKADGSIDLEQLGQKINDRIQKIIPKIPGITTPKKTGDDEEISFVPTAFTMNITLQPIYSRTEIAERFSLKSFAKGELTRDGGFI